MRLLHRVPFITPHSGGRPLAAGPIDVLSISHIDTEGTR